VKLEDLLGTIIRVDFIEHPIPIYGKLLEVSPYWIIIERKSGSRRMISLGRITGIESIEDLK